MIWIIADIVNGLMAIPNLIGLIALRQVVIEETKQYFAASVNALKEPQLQN
jgi:AGCS family alanine or glycine:cation symporter